jgi:hypothetical protein
MLLTLFLLLVFAAVAAGVWFHGLWGGVVTLVNLLISGLVATSFYEPATAQLLDLTSRDYSYLMDFLVLWGIFAFTFGILRLITDMISPKRLKFHPTTELVGRSVMCVIVAYVMVMFTAMTIHTAPLQASPFNGAWSGPNDASFLGMKPEAQWLGFVRGQSQMGLSGGTVFDQSGAWLNDHYQRRQAFEKEEGFLAR